MKTTSATANKHAHLLRTAIGALVVVQCNLLNLAWASNPPGSVVVYPTGNFPDDVQNVQAALDRGGTVLLKALSAAKVPTAFNFGTSRSIAEQSGFVRFSKDAAIVGEHVGSHQTTINGGAGPIQSLQPVKSKIQGIDFESPFDDVIQIAVSTGCEITDNTIHNVQPVEVIIVATGEVLTFADGIDFSGYNFATGESDPEQITGAVLISGNVIDGMGALFSNGIQFDTTAAESVISGNTIRNVYSAATENGSGITLVRSEKTMIVENNLIAPGPSDGYVTGIFIGGNQAARYGVFNNIIYSDGPLADGIFVTGGDAVQTTVTQDALIGGNQIFMENGTNAGGIVFADLVTNSYAAGNMLHGDASNALVISTQGFETNIASQNAFVDNDLTHFASSQSDVFFDTNAQHNRMIGRCDTIIDLGLDNSSTCGERKTTNATMQTVFAPDFVSSGHASTGKEMGNNASLRSILRELPAMQGHDSLNK